MDSSSLVGKSKLPYKCHVLRARARMLLFVPKLRDFARCYGKLIVVSAFSLLIVIAGAPPILDLYHQITALEYERSQNMEQFQEELSNKGETMDDLSRIVDSPQLLSPPASAHINSLLAELHWTVPEHGAADYLVEIRPLGSSTDTIPVHATNPDDGIHHLTSDLAPGVYAWRVARRTSSSAANELGTAIDSGGSTDLWSGYSIFSVLGPISETELTIAINYAQQSRFMTRTPNGSYCGYDWELISWISRELGRRPVPHEYPTVPAMLAATANGLEDVAIGSITRTRSREEKGFAFTDGYLKSPPVLACMSKDSDCPSEWSQVVEKIDGDEVGVIQDTTNDDLAMELQRTLHFVRKPVGSVDSLIRALETGRLGWILIDRPLINGACERGIFRCIRIPIHLPKYEAEIGRRDGEEYALAADNEHIRREVDKLLAKQKTREFLHSLSEKYLSGPPDIALSDKDCRAASNSNAGQP